MENINSEGYKEEETLRYLYHEKEKSLADIGRIFDKSPSTIYRWMVKNEVDRRTDALGGTMKRRVERASYYTDSRGYPLWSCWSSEEGNEYVRVHQLLAIACGAEPNKIFGGKGNTVVHHKNGIPFDNRPKNIEKMDAPKHIEIHNPQERR